MSKTNNVVNIGHNSNQLTDKLIETLNKLNSAIESVDKATMQFERSCKGRMDRFDTKKMHWSDKAEWFDRGKNTNERAVSIIDNAIDNIKNYLKSCGIEFEKKGKDANVPCVRAQT